MEKPEFLVGSEKRFFDFIAKVNDKDKIVIVSHIADLDGIVSAKIVNSVIDANMLKFADYHELNDDLAKELKSEKAKKVIFLDLNFTKDDVLKEIEKFAEILIIDHHLFDIDFNSERTVFLNAQGYCASYLCYYLFSKIQNIEKYDWLVACTSLSDWCFMKNTDWMRKIYKKYSECFSDDSVNVKKGKFWDLQYNLSLAIAYFKKNKRVNEFYDKLNVNFGKLDELGKYCKIVKKEVDERTEKFRKDRETFGDIYFIEMKMNYPISEFIINELSFEEINKTYIITYEYEGKYFKITSRRQDKKINLPEMLKKLTAGFENATSGGHFAAAGANILLKDSEEFKKRLKLLNRNI